MRVNDTLLKWKETSKLLEYFGDFQGKLQNIIEAVLREN